MFQWKINLLRKIFPKDFLLVLSEISSTVGFPSEKCNTRIILLHPAILVGLFLSNRPKYISENVRYG